MRIKQLRLFTDRLEQEKDFYSNTLGFGLIKDTVDEFSVQVGWSELLFTRSEKPHTYHYCFLIPGNKLEQAITWMQGKVTIIDIEKGRLTQRFESWNAESFYFHDANGNLAECIVRHDLQNEDHAMFDHNSILCVNEIGLPVTDIKRMNKALEQKLETSFWKGDFTRFGTNGSQEGLFLLCNYNIKSEWFPTNQKVVPEPFRATIESKGSIYNIAFKQEEVHLE